VRVVFVNRYFHPDHSATSQMLSDLAFALAAEGHAIHVVTSRLRYDDPAAALPKRETVRGVQVLRVYSSRFGRARLAGRLIDYLSFYPAVFFALLGLLRPGDLAVAKTDPPLLSLPVWLAARLRGAALVNWLQDLFPEAAAALGIRAAQGPAGRLLAGLRDFTLRQAAANVTPGRRMAEDLSKRGIPRVETLPNWADGEAIRPLAADANPLRAEWGLEGRCVAAYSGNLGRAHESATWLAAAEILRGEPGIAFLFIGGGHGYGLLREEAARRGLDNILFKPYQPRERLGLSLTLPDVHLISLLPELEGLIVPSKFYGALAAGRPVAFVGAEDGELAREIARHGCGARFAPGEAQALAGFLLRLSREPGSRRAMGENARAAFEREFDLAGTARRWRDLLAAVRR
jgi:glycosyltransferase involved in cell wall biosynthesis